MINNITQKFLDMIKLPDDKCRNLNYLIVMPPIVKVNMQYMFPSGIAIVTASLKASGRNVFSLNLTYKDNYLELLRNTIEEKNRRYRDRRIKRLIFSAP